MFEHDSVLRKEYVKRVCVFSPDLAKQHCVVIRKISDLEQHPELLLFEGSH